MRRFFAVAAFIVLTILTAGISWAVDLPDVTKWNCPADEVDKVPEYNVAIYSCYDANGKLYNEYLKVGDELVYVHEHRNVSDKLVIYNALKQNNGTWVEVTGSEDTDFDVELVQGGSKVSIADSSGEKMAAERFVPKVKK